MPGGAGSIGPGCRCDAASALLKSWKPSRVRAYFEAFDLRGATLLERKRVLEPRRLIYYAFDLL
jgi:hypothetical protein